MKKIIDKFKTDITTISCFLFTHVILASEIDSYSIYDTRIIYILGFYFIFSAFVKSIDAADRWVKKRKGNIQ
ncbi:hypothetical protein AB832_04615 [Flavobacteriaceae bacterium (ex Bugula neritina AB1)]|jgi:hypothetical protein|nr:hypothetical protein AB832_04615 [Flavobacteriaceae bacterium (ex Bugula neritina AB1)]